jgi:hypothetical protein
MPFQEFEKASREVKIRFHQLKLCFNKKKDSILRPDFCFHQVKSTIRQVIKPFHQFILSFHRVDLAFHWFNFIFHRFKFAFHFNVKCLQFVFSYLIINIMIF